MICGCLKRNAIILAAGLGMRMVPINQNVPKALLEVRGEPLIERQIHQLREAGIDDITVVIGFKKEKFEYLKDKYGVTLVDNPDFDRKNNLFSLALVAEKIADTYIISSDLWFAENPFLEASADPWYMVADTVDKDSDVIVTADGTLVGTASAGGGNAIIGIAHLAGKIASAFREKLVACSSDPAYDHIRWEALLYEKKRFLLPPRMISSSDYIEINTYEQLRDWDDGSAHLHSDALDAISEAFHIPTSDISGIRILKKGMTNRSFLFSADNRKYIMRVPGEGTDRLINRAQEAEVFRTIAGHGLCDDPVYLNPRKGYKITRYLENVRVCDAYNPEDLKKCMALLRSFHEMRLAVPHTFDIFGQIEFYEELWNGKPSEYRDYAKTKKQVLGLREFIDRQPKAWCLTHIDAVPDNFLFYKTQAGEALQLTDWEYAGMQDPHVDLAMFAIYSYYNKRQIDRMIKTYFEGDPGHAVRAKIYAYVAACGLLWSNWTEYKNSLGVNFGDYGERQYKYAKDYCRYALKEMQA